MSGALTAPSGRGPVAILVGAPGSGKTTVGTALAERLGVSFRDTDHDVEEIAVAEAPLSLWRPTFPLALVSGVDGLRAELDGRTAWVTTDDLLAAQAYDHAATFLDPSLGMGVDREIVLGLLERALGAPRARILEHATLARVRFERRLHGKGAAIFTGYRGIFK